MTTCVGSGVADSIDEPGGMLAGFFEHALSAAQIIRPDGHSVLVNQAFRVLFGTRPSLMYDVVEDGLLRRAFAGETISLPPRLQRDPDMEPDPPIAIESTLFPLYDRAGAIRFVARTCREVTAERIVASPPGLPLAEGPDFALAALRESEERLRVLHDLTEATRDVDEPEEIMPVALRVLGRHLKVSRCAFADVDADGNGFTIPRDYTDGCASIVGFYQLSLFGPRAVAELRRGETLVVRDVDAELSGAEGADMFNAIAVKALICCSLVKNGEFRAMMAVHQTTPRNWTASDIAIVQEVVERCWAAIEQRRAEAKLRHSEAMLRIAGRTARLGGWSVEVPGRITWSDEVCTIHDVPAGTIPTVEQAFAYYAPEFRDTIRAKFDDCLRAGVPFDVESQLITAKDRRIWVRAIGQAERNAARVIVRIQRAFQEITDRKQTEAQLMVSDRMASVGTLAAGVAHEINNPLASVTANLALAEQEIVKLAAQFGVPQDLLDEMRDAREAAERVRVIVRDLKVFSHSDEERFGPIDVEHVLESTLRLAWNEIRHRAQLVKVYGGVPRVEGNEGRLGQVFLNLIVNAAQAIPDGASGAQIRIETSIGSANRVVISVADTGSGIPRDLQSRMFTPFLTTKAVGVGTGLGLSICHRIITAMRGTIEFSSEVGKGTVFRVTLPISRSQLAIAPVVVAEPTFSARRGTILIVDDERMIGQTLRRILATEHDVTSVQSAAQALTMLRAGDRFDVVFCDLMMPQVTGMDLHAAMLELDAAQAARMVFMTGGAFTPKAREFLESVSNRRIEKPFDIPSVRTLVTSLLGKSPS